MPVDVVHLVALVAVGFTAGVVSVVVSLASVVSYPALLALGLPPVAANVTNTVALTFTGLGAAAGSRRELAGQGRRVALIGVLTSVAGGVGALVLLRTPPGAFTALVPVLVAGASVVILVQPRLTLASRTSGAAPSRWWLVGIVAAAVYMGYFGAAGGVLMLAALDGLLRDDLVRLNALKAVVAGIANATATVWFVLDGPVVWTAVGPLAAGFLAGGFAGPAVVRRLPPGRLRAVVATAGLAVAAWLAVRSWR